MAWRKGSSRKHFIRCEGDMTNNNSRLSVVISAYNEENNIKDCIVSVKFADEIIVVDNESTDNTSKIAKEAGSLVFSKKNNLMLNVNKNFGFTKARNDWILSIDADERITPELAKAIAAVLDTGGGINGYWIPRKNIIFGKWMRSGIWWPDYQLRLFRKDKGRFEERHVHEYIQVTGETQKMDAPIVHYNYSSISQFLIKMDKIYTENEASLIAATGKKVNWIDAVRFPVNDFLKTFFAQKGYKDGLHGLVLSILQAFYAEVVFAKVWEKQGFPEGNSTSFLNDIQSEFKKIQKEFRYWLMTALMIEAKNPLKRFRYRLLRKAVKKKDI